MATMKKKSATRRTGRSADASAGAAAVKAAQARAMKTAAIARVKANEAKAAATAAKKIAARTRATGQTKESSMDAAGRRFKVTDRVGSFAEVQDRVSGVYKDVSTNPKKVSQSKAQSETGYTRNRATNASLRRRASYKVPAGERYGDLKQFFGK